MSSLKSEFSTMSSSSFKSGDSFKAYQEKINRLFKKYKYDRIKLENNCTDKKQAEEEAKNDDRIVNFTKSQDFISHYFQHMLSPRNPNKGVLVWHSVGTGKTCTALATKSFTYDKQNWSILWVTRGTLREDIWKNMFDKVCDYGIRERILNGEDIPTNPKNLRKYVSSRFLRPMSYRQFFKSIEKSGPRYEEMVKRNGTQDILQKTLIIVDEAHKLFDTKEITGAEKPDVEAIQNGIWNSYQTSGKDSCRLMLMTGTPVNEAPMEMIRLLNMLIGNERNRINPETFDKKYLDQDNNFTTQGKERFQNKIKGLVSYLNRSSDPRQFAIPEFNKIVVPISRQDLSNLELERCEDAYNTTYNKCIDEISAAVSISNCYQRYDQMIAKEEQILAQREQEVKDNPKRKCLLDDLRLSKKTTTATSRSNS